MPRRLSIHFSLCVLLVALATTVSTSLRAQEWTRFRGPNGTGISRAKDIPTKWTEDDYNWRVEVPGVGHSHPVIWGDRLFLTSSTDKGETRELIAMATEDGSILWRRKVKSATHPIHVRNSHASGTPCVTADAVYVNFGSAEHNEVHAFDHEGEHLWKHDLGPFVSTHGHAFSPIVFEDLLVVANDQGGEGKVPAKSYLLALDRKSGEVRWKIDRETSRVSYSTPAVYTEPNGDVRLVFASIAHGLTSVDPRAGKVVWEADCFELRTCSSPQIAGDLILGTCGSGGGGNYLVAVRMGGKGDVLATHEAYRLKKAMGYVPTPIVDGDRLYVFADKGGIVSAYDVKKGGEPLWQERLEGLPEFSGSPVLVDGRLYAISHDGDVYVVAAKDTFELLAKIPLGEPSRSTPAIAGGRMYLRTDGHLISVGGAKVARVE